MRQSRWMPRPDSAASIQVRAAEKQKEDPMVFLAINGATGVSVFAIRVFRFTGCANVLAVTSK